MWRMHYRAHQQEIYKLLDGYVSNATGSTKSFLSSRYTIIIGIIFGIIVCSLMSNLDTFIGVLCLLLVLCAAIMFWEEGIKGIFQGIASGSFFSALIYYVLAPNYENIALGAILILDFGAVCAAYEAILKMIKSKQQKRIQEWQAGLIPPLNQELLILYGENKVDGK